MKIPDKKKEPFTYNKWKELGLLKATDIERILMLELASIEHFHKWLHGSTWWDLKDMRKFVKHISEKIEKCL